MVLIFTLMTLFDAVGQTGTWPFSSNYVYFGANELNQGLVGTYAVLQEKTIGVTYVNYPIETRFRIGNEDKMILTTSGKFGIGTQTPSTLLSLGQYVNSKLFSLYDNSVDWYGFGIQDTQMRLQVPSDARFSFFGGDSNEIFTVKGDGRVGVGIVAPVYKFHVKSADLQHVIQTDGSGNNRAIMAFGDASGALKGSVGLFGADGSIRIGDADDYRIVVKQGGNVGIGTTSPDQKLTVNGTIHATEVKVTSAVPGPDYVFENHTIFSPSVK